MFKRILLLTAWVVGLQCVALPAFSESAMVEAEGMAPIRFNDLKAAKKKAMREAIREAAYQAGINISSKQMMKNGQMVVDNLQLASNVGLDRIKILDESIDDGFYVVKISAQVLGATKSCPDFPTNHYRKTVAVTGFRVLHPAETQVGELWKADREYARHLATTLQDNSDLIIYRAFDSELYPEGHHAPTTMTPQFDLTNLNQISREHGAQFVVSGMIRDIGMTTPVDDTLWSFHEFKEFWDLQTNRQRRFEVEVFIHDGFSGELLHTKRYDIVGTWDLRERWKVGFGSAKFWQTDFARKVKRLTNQAVADINASINCKPFMTRILHADGNRIRFDLGAMAGIRSGDTLNVYRTSTFYDRDQNPYVEISDAKIVATVKQVQPNYAIAEIIVDHWNVNIQPDDLVIAW